MADINRGANLNALVGTNAGDNIYSFEGNETVFGASGNDNIYSSPTRDVKSIVVLPGERGRK